MVYYELLEDGTIGRGTNNAGVAKRLGLTLATDKKIVCGYNGKRYLEDEVPAAPPDALARQTVAVLESKYNLPRPVRTALLLAREAGLRADERLMARVEEIEAAALPLRAADAGGGE